MAARIDDLNGTVFLPANEMEEFGLEDPRITQIGDRYYITYVAVSRHGPATALASTTDFKTLDRHGIIFCPENKDVVLLPERVNGEYVALHRPLGDMPFCRPEMWIARSPDLVHWGRHEYLFAGAGEWEDGRVGAGAPPIEVPEGGSKFIMEIVLQRSVGEVGAYCAGAMLLGERRSWAACSKSAAMRSCSRGADFENEGFVSKVVFPTGVVEEDDRLLIYYGASDKYCAMVEVSRDDVHERAPLTEQSNESIHGEQRENSQNCLCGRLLAPQVWHRHVHARLAQRGGESISARSSASSCRWTTSKADTIIRPRYALKFKSRSLPPIGERPIF